MRISFSIGVSISSGLSISAPLSVQVDEGVSRSIVGKTIVESMGIGISVSISAPLAKEVMGQTKGGWANVASGVTGVEGNSSSMGLSASLPNEMRGRVSMREAKSGGANVAGGVTRVEGYSRLSTPLAIEMRKAKCGWTNIAGGVAWMEGNSSSVGLSTALANMRVSPHCGSHIAGGEARVDCHTKTKAMGLSQGSGKEGGGENLRIEAVIKRMMVARRKNLQRTSCC